MRKLKDVINNLPAERKEKVIAGTRELIAEEHALRSLRKAHKLTQEDMAMLLNTDQASISKMEQRSDMLISTMRRFVEAMGGTLRLCVDFPDSGRVEIPSFGEVFDSPCSSTKKPKSKRRPKLTAANDLGA